LIWAEGEALRPASTGLSRTAVTGAKITAHVWLTMPSIHPLVPFAVAVPLTVVPIMVAVPITVAASVGSFTALIQTMDARSVALDVVVWEFLLVNCVPVVAQVRCCIPVIARTEGFIYVRRHEVTDTGFRISIDEGHDAAEVEVVRKIAIIAGVAKGIDLSLEERDNVGILGVRDGTQEDGGAGARVEVVVLLGLQAKVH